MLNKCKKEKGLEKHWGTLILPPLEGHWGPLATIPILPPVGRGKIMWTKEPLKSEVLEKIPGHSVPRKTDLWSFLVVCGDKPHFASPGETLGGIFPLPSLQGEVVLKNIQPF